MPDTSHEPLPVVLDVDTGVDDALALLFAAAHPGIDVRAVTCVAGNVPLQRVVHNTLAVLDHTGLPPDLPVAAGCARPLIQEPEDASHVHGSTGLGGIDLPASQRRRLFDGHAVDLLRSVLAATEQPITLVTLAPMTNIAVLLRLAPDLVTAKVSRIVAMVGAVEDGNVTAAAEFNAYADAHAAAIVFASGVPVTMYGWDVFREVRIPRPDVDLLKASARPDAVLAGRLLQAYADVFELAEPYIGDAGAVCAAIDPEGLTTAHVPVFVETAGRSAGRTVVDRRPSFLDTLSDPTGPAPPSADVALDVDVPRYRNLFLDALLGVRHDR